jgi:hypothetical protein
MLKGRKKGPIDFLKTAGRTAGFACTERIPKKIA